MVPADQLNLLSFCEYFIKHERFCDRFVKSASDISNDCCLTSILSITHPVNHAFYQ